MRELVAVKRIRMVLNAVAGDGHDVVPIPVLRDYLDAVERESDADVETVKLHQAIESARERIAFEDRVEVFKSLIGLGSTTKCSMVAQL